MALEFKGFAMPDDMPTERMIHVATVHASTSIMRWNADGPEPSVPLHPEGQRVVWVTTPFGRAWRSQHRKVAARIHQRTPGRVKRVTQLHFLNRHGVLVVSTVWI